MNRRAKGNRIVWLVRILTIVGLAIVVTTTGLVGWTLAGMRHERAEVNAEEARLDRASQLLRESAHASEKEIQTTLDETIPWKAAQPAVAADFAALIREQRHSLASATVAPALDELSTHAAHLIDLAARARTWRASYVPAWEDLRDQRTMNRVRQLILQLRNAMETIEGRRRLDNAIDHQRWRRATGEEAAGRAREILLAAGRQESEGGTDFDSQLAELARLVELLGGEEQFDNLTDLKDNKLKPVLDRLSRSIGVLDAQGISSGTLRPQAIEELKIALFGEGYRNDEAHQGIAVGSGGLFTLRRDALALRRERERLKSQLTTAAQQIEAIQAEFMRSAQTRSAALTQQTEQSLASAWNHLLLFGGGSAVLFFWLAWRITHGIDGQVHLIEQARREAEASRQALQQLLLEQQRVAAELAEAHGELQASEHQLRSSLDELANVKAALDAHAIVAITDHRGVITFANDKFCEISQYSKEEILGKDHRILNSGHHPKEFMREMWRTIASGKVWRGEVKNRAKDGTFYWVDSTIFPFVTAEGKPSEYVSIRTDITARKLADEKLEQVNRQMLEISRQAGMAEVATSVLHNVGNVLNSVNVAAICVAEGLRKSKVSSLTRVVAMLREHDGDLGAFFSTDARARQLPGFLAQLTDHLASERAGALAELGHLQKNIEHIKDIVAMQQTYAKISGVTETLQITDLIEDTLRMNAESFAHHELRVVRDFAEVPPVTVEKHKVLQILINLVRNAKHACDAGGRPDKTMTLRVFNGNGTVKIAVADNGIGIPAENLTRIFNYGFTTKKEGHGFGLHSGALTAHELGGALRVESEGPGQGATFTLELPVTAST